MGAATTAGEPSEVTSIALVELQYLIEKMRLPAAVLDWLRTERDDEASAFELSALTRQVADALPAVSRDAVPDKPDRIIAATSDRLGLPLVTSDHKIRASGVAVIW